MIFSLEEKIICLSIVFGWIVSGREANCETPNYVVVMVMENFKKDNSLRNSMKWSQSRTIHSEKKSVENADGKDTT